MASEFNGYVRYRSYEASASDLLNNFFIIADLSPVPGMEEIASNPSMTDSQVIVQRWVNLILRKRRMTDFLKRVITNMPLPILTTNWHKAQGLEEYCNRQEVYISRLELFLS